MGSAVQVIVIIAAICVPLYQTSASWNYEEGSGIGPEDWHWNYSMCGWESQSPIDIVTTIIRPSLAGLTLNGYNAATTSKFTLSNNGHSAQVSVNTNTIKISGAELESTYILEQFHFHWGADNSGSEHTVGGQHYPLEIHFVHYKDIYQSVSDASAHVNDSSALAVLGVLVDVSPDVSRQSTGLNDIVSNLHHVVNEGDSTPVDQFALSSLVPCRQSFYRYNGSLTTPGCAEVVLWTVFAQPIYIDQTKLDEFRHLYNSEHQNIVKNFRPTQLQVDRSVYRYEDTSLCLVDASVGAGNRLTSGRGLVILGSAMAAFVLRQ